MEIVELLWDEENIAHIARHSVSTEEVTEVLLSRQTIIVDSDTPLRPGRLVAFGPTKAARMLAVLLDRPAAGRSYVLTARSMTPREKRTYKQRRVAHHDENED